MGSQMAQTGAAEGPFIGIDFGASVTRMAYARTATAAALIPDLSGESPLPSVLTLSPQGGVVAGPGARERQALFPRDTLLAPKVLITADAARLQRLGAFFPHPIDVDATTVTQIEIGGRKRSSLELVATYLAYLRRTGEAMRGEPIRSAVLTVPTIFGPFDRQLLRLAAELAGFRRVRLIDDPAAVALAWAAAGGRGRAAVCTWGAEYFSAAIVQADNELVRVLASTGAAGIGGDVLDIALAEDFLRRSREADAPAFANEAHVFRFLRLAAEKTKRELSAKGSAELRLPLAEQKSPLRHTYQRADLDAWLLPLRERSASLVRAMLAEAGAAGGKPDVLLLSGGLTHVPSLAEHLAELFRCRPSALPDSDDAGAYGALARARRLDRVGSDPLLLDVLSAAQGLEAQGGQVSAMLARGIAVPAGKVETFTTYLDQQTEVGVQLFSQTEREWTAAAQVQISRISPMKAGQPMLEVSFVVDEDGVLDAGAREVLRGRPLSCDLRPVRGLTSAQVNAARQNLTPAAEDFASGLRRALRERAGFLLRGVREAARTHPGSMTRDEKQLIAKKSKELEDLLDTGESGEIRAALQELEEVAQPLRVRILDLSLQPLLR